ncbi:MAG: hypothetical protein ABL903_03925 [Methylococcales bacterium]
MTSKPLLLLDTHIWFWWVTSNSKLPRQIGQAIEANDRPIGIACVSVYELVFLIQKQKDQHRFTIGRMVAYRDG